MGFIYGEISRRRKITFSMIKFTTTLFICFLLVSCKEEKSKEPVKSKSQLYHELADRYREAARRTAELAPVEDNGQYIIWIGTKDTLRPNYSRKTVWRYDSLKTLEYKYRNLADSTLFEEYKQKIKNH
jgi:hypothetical protein